MSRALVLLAAAVFFRAFFVDKRRRSITETSPYVNSLDGLLAPEELSSVLNETSQLERLSHRAGAWR